MGRPNEGKNHVTKKSPLRHRSSEYADLSWLIGEPLQIVRGIEFESGKAPDGKVEILKDYGRTILIRMEYIESDWGITIPPRYILTQRTKAAIACGDLVLQTRDGMKITPDTVSGYGYAEMYGREMD